MLAYCRLLGSMTATFPLEQCELCEIRLVSHVTAVFGECVRSNLLSLNSTACIYLTSVILLLNFVSGVVFLKELISCHDSVEHVLNS